MRVGGVAEHLATGPYSQVLKEVLTLMDVDFAGRLIAMRLVEVKKEIGNQEIRQADAIAVLELLRQEQAQLEAALEKLQQ